MGDAFSVPFILSCFKHINCGQALIFWGKSLPKDMFFLCPQWSSGPYISRNFLFEHILWMHLEKNRTYACTFPVQRKEINVVKVRFTMRYSSRKLSNDKVITTACNFWRQIACSFQVTSGNILFLVNKIFEIPPFFQTRPGDLGKKVHACSLLFSAWSGKLMVNIYNRGRGVLNRDYREARVGYIQFDLLRTLSFIVCDITNS